MNKYKYQVVVPTRKGEQTTIHEYFALTQENAEEKLRARFGPDATLRLLKETTLG